MVLTNLMLLLFAPTWLQLERNLPSGALTTTRECIVDTVLDPNRPSFSSERPTLFRERNGWCPYSERVWIALEAKRIPYDTILIDNMGRGRPSYFSGQTPQLRYPNGDMQSESMDIIRRLDQEYPDHHPLYPPNNAADQEVVRLVNAFKSTFPRNTRPSSRSAFLFYNSGQPVFRSEFEETLTKTDELLAKHDGPFFYGNEFTAADCCWAPFLERYSFQLPILHRGLNPRDASRWPHLAAWFDHMETSEVTGFYPSRVQGDRESWEKVLFMSGYGNDGNVPSESGSTSQSTTQPAINPSASASASTSVDPRTRDLNVFARYSREPTAVVSAETPSEEAAVRMIRNRAAIVADILREAGRGSSGSDSDSGMASDCRGLSSDDIDRALRFVVASLLPSAAGTGVGTSLSAEDTADESVTDESVTPTLLPAADRIDDDRLLHHAQQVTSYFIARMCIPRDMGVLPARSIRDLHLRLQSSNII